MIESLFNQTNYTAAKKMMDATVLRQEAIASNLGNVETPGYRRLDVAPTFQSELAQAMRSGASGDLRQVRPVIQEDGSARPVGPDGNSVDLEEEIMHLADNQMAHQMEAKMISATLAKLRLAITGRPQ